MYGRTNTIELYIEIIILAGESFVSIDIDRVLIVSLTCTWDPLPETKRIHSPLYLLLHQIC